MNENIKSEIKKKILTSTIGSLARFEKYFGHLWGHNKEHLTEQEERMLDLWEEARYEILNLGNQQIRSLDTLFPVPFQEKFHYKFNMKKSGDTYED
jgi:hypothetical protein